MKFTFMKRRIRISTKVALSFFAIVILQGTLMLIAMSVLIMESSSRSFQKQMDSSIDSVHAYLVQTLDDLENKATLLAGQRNIITYTNYELVNLLNRELVLFSAPLELNGIYVFQQDGSLMGSSDEFLLQSPQLTEYILETAANGSREFIIDTKFDVHYWRLSQIQHDDEVIGILGISVALDKKFMDKIEQISGSLAVIHYANRIIYSSDFDLPKLSDIIAVTEEGVAKEGKVIGDYLYRRTPLDPYGFHGAELISILNIWESRKLISSFNRLGILMSLAVLIIAFIVTVLFYRHSFLRPYKVLQEGVARIGEGDYSYSISHSSADEFGELVDSVELMRERLQSREQQLTALIGYNELILNNVRSGIVTIDEGGKINAWNDAARKLIHVPEAEGPALPARIQEVNLPEPVKEIIFQGLNSGIFVTQQECRVSYDGQDEILSVTTSPFSGGEGEQFKMIAVIADITQVHNLEEQLQISRRLAAIGEMVAGVAHQLRNPMAVMKVSAEFLHNNYHIDEKHEHLTKMLVTEIDSLNYVIDNFLDFARPIHANPTACEIKSVIEDALSLVPLSQFPTVSVETIIDSELTTVLLDKDLMEQVISNLVLNALEASDENARQVTIHAGMVNGHLHIAVRDNGCGMESKTMQNIFNPFYTMKNSGTGLGLSIAHRIVQEHGGYIDISSEPGIGSTFTIII